MKQIILLALLAGATMLTGASAEDANWRGLVTISNKKPWANAGEKGFTVNYRMPNPYTGKTTVGRGAKVHCEKNGEPVYLVENLDRGDGKKVGMLVSEDGVSLAKEIAPVYMEWAIDVWLLACRS